MEGSVYYDLESPPRPSRKLDSEQRFFLKEILKTTFVKISEKNSAKAGEYPIYIHEPCIYRVPSRIRNKKPEAYTPQMVVIGPLHRQKPTDMEALDGFNPWHIKEEYSKMEEIKKMYLQSFTERVGEDTIQLMLEIIEADEINIRGSYNESTEWIKSLFFADLILHDSIFILEFIIIYYEQEKRSVEEIPERFPFDIEMVKNDLIMLENQIPFFILDNFFSPILKGLVDHWTTLPRIILPFFRLFDDFTGNFKHFTDMFRCVYEASLEPNIREQMRTDPLGWPAIKEMGNADKLSHAGVDFKSFDNLKKDFYHLPIQVKRPTYKERIWGFSLHVEFKKGTLSMPEFHANKESDMILRNVVAYEQCDTAVTPFTSNYIHFLNFLITSNRDVQLLIEEGVVMNTMGRPSFVVDMVNDLQDSVKQGTTSQYHFIAMDLKHHCKSRRKRNWATLNKVYFSDLWTGTATIAGVLLLLMTFVSTVASVIQAYKSFK